MNPSYSQLIHPTGTDRTPSLDSDRLALLVLGAVLWCEVPGLSQALRTKNAHVCYYRYNQEPKTSRSKYLCGVGRQPGAIHPPRLGGCFVHDHMYSLEFEVSPGSCL